MQQIPRLKLAGSLKIKLGHL